MLLTATLMKSLRIRGSMILDIMTDFTMPNCISGISTGITGIVSQDWDIIPIGPIINHAQDGASVFITGTMTGAGMIRGINFIMAGMAFPVIIGIRIIMGLIMEWVDLRF